MTLLTEKEKELYAEENLRLVHYTANQFRNTRLPYDDLYGAALLGFTKALNSFDTEKGTKFSTYAVNCMKNEIRFYLRKERRHSDNCKSYNNILSTDKNGNDFEGINTIINESEDAQEAADLLIQQENEEAILRAVSRLTELEQYIINHRYGLNGFEFKTQKEIAEEINMSQANVSKIQKNCLRKIKKFLLEDYDMDEDEFMEQYGHFIS